MCVTVVAFRRPRCSDPALCMRKLFFWGVLAAGYGMSTASLNAGLFVESRETLLQASTQFGYIGSVNTAIASASYHSPTSDLQSQLIGNDSGDGPLGDTSWVANYEYRLDQTIEYLAGGIAANGSVGAFAFAGDQGVASVDAMSGNRLELGFSLDAAETYQFSGMVQELTTISFERSLGSGLWTPVVEPGIGAFNHTLALEAGQYRLTAIGGGYHNSSQGEGSSWSFQLVAVPEPGSMVALTSALLLCGVVGRSYLRRSMQRRE